MSSLYKLLFYKNIFNNVIFKSSDKMVKDIPFPYIMFGRVPTWSYYGYKPFLVLRIRDIILDLYEK